MFNRILLVPLTIASLSLTLLAAPAQADESLTITGVTIEDLPAPADSPYLPGQGLAVSFTDPTPGDPSTYQISLYGRDKTYDGVVAVRGEGGGLVGVIPAPTWSQSMTLEVRELEGDTVVATSPAFAYDVVASRHPQSMLTNATYKKGAPSFASNQPLRIYFQRPRWEAGTRFDTRVFVSDGPTFTAQDLARNLDGAALVDAYDTTEPVRKVKLPRRVVGRYLWISVAGRVEGKVGYSLVEPAGQVVLVKDEWKFKRITRRHDGVCSWLTFDAGRLVGGAGRHVFLQESWNGGRFRNAVRQTTTRTGRFDFDVYGPKAKKRYQTRRWDVMPPYKGGQMRWTQRLVVPGDETHKRFVGGTCILTLG
jgi:hypothetical protein